ncbi:MAG: hypothetical protein ACO3F2_09770 [Roseiflexaceae bacterium]
MHDFKDFYAKLHPIVLYSVLMVLWFSPFIFGQQVLFTRIPESMVNTEYSFWDLNIYTKNAKLSDYLNQEVVEAYLSQNEPRSGLLATWTNRSGLGRALFPHFGYTQSNFATWISTLFSENTLVVFTIRNLIFIYLAGLFLLLYGLTLGLNRWATIIASFMYATLPMFTFWSVNMPFFVGSSLGVAAIYGIHQLIHKPSFGYWVFVALIIHLQITTAYLQTTVYVIYFLTLFSLILLYQQHTTTQVTLKKFSILATASLLGLIASIPMIADLYIEYLSSIRSNSPIIAAYVFPITKPDQLIQLILPAIYDGWITTVSKEYKLFPATQTTILYFLLVIIALWKQFRRVYGWVIMLTICYLLSHNQTLNEFMFTTIFPNISSGTKSFNWATLHIPLAMLMLWGTHTVITDIRKREWIAFMLILISGVFVMWQSILVGSTYSFTIDWNIFALYAIVILLVGVSIIIRSQHFTIPILFIAAISTSAFVTFPRMYRAPVDAASETIYIYDVSAKYLLENTNMMYYDSQKRNCCYAVGNISVLYDINSIHLYKSSVSAYYRNFIQSLDGTFFQKRRNSGVTPTFNEVDFWLSNTSLVVSDTKLNHPNLQLVHTERKLHFYTNAVRSGCCVILNQSVQAKLTRDKYQNIAMKINDKLLRDASPISKAIDLGDKYTILINKKEVTQTIVLSQIYHSMWFASVKVDDNWIEAQTVVVNGKYQGVIIPPNSTELRMQFLPWSRLMWIFHGMWICLILIWGIRRALSYKNTRLSGVSSV